MQKNNKLGVILIVTCGCFSTTASAVNFVATDAITTQFNANVTGLIGGGVNVAPTTATTVLPGPFTLTSPLSALPATLGQPTSATLSGFPAPITVPVLTKQATLAGQPSQFKGLASNGQLAVVRTFGNIVTATVASPKTGLTYSNFGNWILRPAPATGATSAGVVKFQQFAGGTQLTTALQMPKVGTAIYSGKIEGTGISNLVSYNALGNVTLTANFVTKGITGTASAIAVKNANTGLAAGTFNNLALTGTFVGNAFTGNARTLAGPVVGPANPMAMAANVTGTIKGKFYGPTANEVSGIFGFTPVTGKCFSGAFGAKR